MAVFRVEKTKDFTVMSKLATPISNGGLTLTPPGYSTGIR